MIHAMVEICARWHRHAGSGVLNSDSEGGKKEAILERLKLELNLKCKGAGQEEGCERAFLQKEGPVRRGGTPQSSKPSCIVGVPVGCQRGLWHGVNIPPLGRQIMKGLVPQ